MSNDPDRDRAESRRRWLNRLLAAAAVGLGLYIATFTYWWVRSPSATFINNGKQIHVVEFQWSKAYLRTEPIWAPAFWVVEHVMGYKRRGIVAMFENSLVIYTKGDD